MSVGFNPIAGLIIVSAEVTGAAILRLALDTGATEMLINASLLVTVIREYSRAANTACPERTGNGLLTSESYF